MSFKASIYSLFYWALFLFIIFNMAPAKKQRIHQFRRCCASIVKNVSDALAEEKTNSVLCAGINRKSDRLTAYCGLSSCTVNKLLTDQSIPEPGEPERRQRLAEMSKEDMSLIRPAVVSLIKEKTTPTLDRILEKLKSQDKDWKWGRNSVLKALQFLGFSYNSKRHNYYDRLREDEGNILLRNEYLLRHSRWIDENRPIVYMDESWINLNTSRKKCWHDGTADTVDSIPVGKGPRWIMIGAGSRQGWIPNTFKMWKGNVKSEDYHTEMNGTVFGDWFNKFLLPNVGRNSIIVVDRAPYHMELRPSSKCANSGLKKDQLVNWLLDHTAAFTDCYSCIESY